MHSILGLPHNLNILGPENGSLFLNETWVNKAYLLKETPVNRDYKVVIVTIATEHTALRTGAKNVQLVS